MISKSLISSVADCSIGNILVSDHALVSLEVWPQSEKKKSFSWRFNVSLLQNPDFRQMLKTEFDFYMETNWSSVSSVGMAWEALKAVLRGRIIQYASFIKKSKARELVELEGHIKSAEAELKQRMSSDGLRELTRLKYRYNTILS